MVEIRNSVIYTYRSKKVFYYRASSVLVRFVSRSFSSSRPLVFTLPPSLSRSRQERMDETGETPEIESSRKK